MNSKTISIKELIESGNPPEILFWIGCAGSYDERYKKVTKSFVKILDELNINYFLQTGQFSSMGPGGGGNTEDLIATAYFEFVDREERENGHKIIAQLREDFKSIKGIKIEVSEESGGKGAAALGWEKQIGKIMLLGESISRFGE